MQLKITKWVEKNGGSHKVAKMMKMNEQTVRVWMRGQGSPTSKACFDLISLSKGYLSFKQIFLESTRNKK